MSNSIASFDACGTDCVDWMPFVDVDYTLTDSGTFNNIIIYSPDQVVAVTPSMLYNDSEVIEFMASNQKEVKLVPIEHLINFNYTLKKPIQAKIIYENGEYIADIEDLEIYSFGASEFEVLREINEELTALFEELISMDDKNLGQYPKAWKKILSEYIQ